MNKPYHIFAGNHEQDYSGIMGNYLTSKETFAEARKEINNDDMLRYDWLEIVTHVEGGSPRLVMRVENYS